MQQKKKRNPLRFRPINIVLQTLSSKITTNSTAVKAYAIHPYKGAKPKPRILFKTPLPANGKKCFKELAIDTSHHEGKVHEGPEDLNMLEKEGKHLAVKASAKFNGKKDDGIGCSKALKVKMKIRLVDRDKVAE